ncbi:hypothetical protein D3C86_1850570 [compost metagenome]
MVVRGEVVGVVGPDDLSRVRLEAHQEPTGIGNPELFDWVVDQERGSIGSSWIEVVERTRRDLGAVEPLVDLLERAVDPGK